MKSFASWLIVAFSVVPALAQERTNIVEGHVVSIDEVPVTASDAGILVEVLVEEGDSVADQQLVAKVDNREAVMASNVAKHQYNAAKKQAQNQISVEAAVKSQAVSKAELETSIETNRREAGSFSETEVRRLRLTYERAGLQIDLARFENFIAALDARAKFAQYEQAESMIERRDLKAAHSGFVNQVIKRKGDWVNPGDPVLHLIRMDELRVRARVKTLHYHWGDLINKQVDIIVKLPNGRTERLTGTIGFASPTIEADDTFRIWAQIQNRKENGSWVIGPGMKAEIHLR